MRIQAEQRVLVDTFTRASRAVNNRTPIEVLQGVLCKASSGTFDVIGTDLDITVSARAQQVDVLEDGQVVVLAKLVLATIKTMPKGVVTISSDDGHVEIKGGSSLVRLRALNAYDFPSIDEPDFVDAVEVDGDTLMSALAQVTFAASTDAARPILHGVLVDDGARLVATDSYRLVVRDLPGLGGITGLIPAHGLRELKRTIGADRIRVASDARQAMFGSDRGTLSLRFIEGRYPNYRGLLPDSYQNSVTVNKAQLLEAFGRASILIKKDTFVLIKFLETGLDLEVGNQDITVKEHIDGDGTFAGEDKEIVIAANVKYLKDGIVATEGSEVSFDITDGMKPFIVRSPGFDDFLYLLMPTRKT